MTLYNLFLAIHNNFRWVVIIAALFALYRVYSGWLGKREWVETDRKASTYLGMVMDVQLLLGLILYFLLSPITQAALRDMGNAASAGGETTFFAIEHSITMFVAVVLAHVGSVAARRAAASPVKFRTAAIWFSLSVLALVIAMPWWRPLVRV